MRPTTRGRPYKWEFVFCPFDFVGVALKFGVSLFLGTARRAPTMDCAIRLIRALSFFIISENLRNPAKVGLKVCDSSFISTILYQSCDTVLLR
jgi:hypothetical protein